MTGLKSHRIVACGAGTLGANGMQTMGMSGVLAEIVGTKQAEVDALSRRRAELEAAVAAGLALVGQRRAAVRGTLSLGFASAMANIVGKRIFGGNRPLIDDVPIERRLRSQPLSASFPSGHAASAFATATVLQGHYGWKVGVPAYALGSYIALARMAWNRHHATDVVMGAGFGIASARTVTMSLAKSRFSVGVQPQVGGASVNFTKISK